MSRTLRSLPRRGKTPQRSRPTSLRPEMAEVAAESPSVTMRVHSRDLAVPAQSASSSFVMPRMVVRFFPSVFFASRIVLASKRNLASSISPSFTRPSMSLPEYSGREPNSAGGVVRYSLLCESKLGFTMVEFRKSTTEFLSCPGLMSTFFFLATSQKSVRTFRVTDSTCFPPFLVWTPLTKDRCLSSGNSSSSEYR